ncbi:MAG: hypothetical protein ACLUUO_14055 [Sellimonas intestinalis]
MQKTKHEAGTADLADELTKSPVLACSLNFSHGREHHHGNGIGDGHEGTKYTAWRCRLRFHSG